MSMFSVDHQNYIRKLPEEWRSRLLGMLFLYVFRGTDQAAMRDRLSTWGMSFDFLGWRRQLHSNGALLRDGKISMFRRYCGEVDLKKSFTLSNLERKWLAEAVLFKPLSARLRVLHKVEKRPPLSTVDFDVFAADVLNSDDLRVYIRKYVRKKMKFLVTSYGRSYDELEMDLVGWAQYSLLRAYPRFDDVGHGIAIAKTTVKHAGVNLIKSATAAKQNQLITNEDGSCEATTVSLSGVADDSGQFLTEDGSFIHRSLLVVGINGVSTGSGATDWETLQSIQQLMRSSELTNRHKAFLSIMLGVHDDEFSTFLGSPNEDAIEHIDYTRYMRKACEYMGLPVVRAEGFLGSLKPHLGGHCGYHLN